MTNPELVARKLLNDQGPPEAWQHATREAIEAHLRQNNVASAHWAAVQQHLSAIASRPGAGDLDVYRSARSLIAEQGSHQAWEHAMQQATTLNEVDLGTQVYWLRVADAVTALSKTHDETQS